MASRRLLLNAILFFGFSVAASLASAANSGVTFQGRILKPDGSPLSGSNAQFKMQIRTPDANNCLMYEEIQTINMAGSNGAFGLAINDGTGTRTDTTGFNIDNVFSNSGSFSFDPATCSAGNSYTPSSGDGRTLVALFKDETMTAWEAIPPMKINFTPFAFESKKVQGFYASSLVRVQDSGGTYGNISPLSNANYTELLNIINGTTAQYAKAGQLNGTAMPTMTTGQVLGWNGTTWVSEAAVPTGSVTSSQLAAGAVTTTNISNSVSISTSGTLNSAVTTTNDFKLFAPGSTTLAIDMTAPALTTSYSLVWPLTAGASGQVLTTDGSGHLSWGTGGGGSITALTGDVTASGTGSVAATVAYVGTSTAPAIHTAELAANGATSANPASKIVLRDGFGNFAANAITQASSIFRDSSTNTVTVSAPSAVTSYVLKWPTAQAASSGQVLASDTSGNLYWSSPSTSLPPSGTAGGDLSGTYPSPSVATVGTSTATNIHSAEVAANAATSANTVSKIVARDSNGSFAANVVTANGLTLNNGGSVVSVVNPIGAAYTLTVPGAVGTSGQILSTSGSGLLTWVSPLTSSSAYVQGGNAFGAAATLGSTDNNSLTFLTNNTAKMTITAAGNVGIGTTAASQALSVVGNVAATSGQIYSTAQTSSATSPLTYDTNASNTMVWTNSTSTPTVNVWNMKPGGTYMVVINGGSGTGAVTLNCFSDGGSTSLPSSFVPANGTRATGTLNKPSIP